MSLEAAIAVAALLVPVVLLLSFAGCGTQLPLSNEPVVDQSPDPPPPPPTPPPPPAKPNDPSKYHGLVLGTALDLISYWPLDEAATVGAAEDHAPAPKNHGSYVGPHAVGPGVLQLGPDFDDTAPSFDGTAGHVEVIYDTLLNPATSTDFSVEAWIRPAAASAAGRQVIVGSYRLAAAGALERGFVLDLVGGATPKLRGRTAPDGLVEATLPPAVSEWYHVALTYQAAAKTLRLYVNIPNNLQARATDTTANYTANRRVAATDVAPPLRIGAGQVEPPTAATPPDLFFKGAIDNVVMYRGLLTAAEIQSHFEAARKP